MKRETGFYWIKPKARKEDIWEVAYYDSEYSDSNGRIEGWIVVGVTHIYSDAELDIIEERLHEPMARNN